MPQPLNYENPDDHYREVGGWLKRLFGPARREVWQRFATGVGGTYSDRVRPTIDIPRGPFAIHLTLDRFTNTTRSSTPATIAYVSFDNKLDFQLQLRRAGPLTPLFTRLFHLQDIEIGDPDFDARYVIQGNDEPRIRALLSTPAVRAACDRAPWGHLEILPVTHIPHPLGPGPWELRHVFDYPVKDFDHLESMLHLLDAVLDALETAGIAGPPPGAPPLPRKHPTPAHKRDTRLPTQSNRRRNGN